MNELINLMYQIKDLSLRTNEIALIDLQPRLMAVYDKLVAEQLSICGVVKSVKGKEAPNFREWTYLKGYYQDSLYWFDKGGDKITTTDLVKIYEEEHQL